jgi:hypothetical protein
MALRKQKSRKQQVTGLAVDYLKLKTAGKAAKGAGKGAKKAAKGTAAYQVAKRAPRGRKLPLIVAGAAAAVLVVFKAANRGGGQEPAAA